jgi:GT2 family glycosyltransferase
MNVIENQPMHGNDYQLEKIPPSQMVDIRSIESVKLNIDVAIQITERSLLLVGWLHDPESNVDCLLATQSEQGLLKKSLSARSIKLGENGTQWCRSERVDVSESFGSQELLGHHHGFAMYVPEFYENESFALKLKNGTVTKLAIPDRHTSDQIEKALEPVLKHTGPAVLTVLELALGSDHELTQHLNQLIVGDVGSLQKQISCDHAILLEDNTVILNGWIAEHPDLIDKIEIGDGRSWHRIDGNLHRYMRPDLNQVFPKFGGKPLGFVAARLNGVAKAEQLTLKVTLASGKTSTDTANVEHFNWQTLYGFVQSHHPLFSPLFSALKCVAESEVADNIFRLQLGKFHSMAFETHVRLLPTMVDDADRLITAVDRVFTLGAEGMLVMGWMLNPRLRPAEILVCNEVGDEISIQPNLIRLIREDIVNAFAERVPDAKPRSGFMFYLSMPTEPGDARCLKFRFALGDDVLIKLPTERQSMSGVTLIKNILGLIPHPNRMQHELFEVFDKALGPALEAINQKRSAFKGDIEVRQFGEPPEAPATSIIVPLYGRCDFMRHQLAQFADDAELKQQDLIYVVDDPRLLEEVHGLSAKYQWLFDVPFRIVWYGQNLGFAGANNVGARFARGERLLLLNSDAFPKSSGWVGELARALDDLPDAGAVGPLLQFADDTIQHAGMYPRRDLQLPGFLLNTHIGMGMPYEGTEEPTEHPLLTAACLMLKTQDFNALGGFDEGYVIGDFEDSDLCLGLKKMGKKLYLVPKARLWHLERQSQTLDNVAGTRQLITLFNGWRYLNKIRNGELADPFATTESQSETSPTFTGTEVVE